MYTDHVSDYRRSLSEETIWIPPWPCYNLLKASQNSKQPNQPRLLKVFWSPDWLECKAESVSLGVMLCYVTETNFPSPIKERIIIREPPPQLVVKDDASVNKPVNNNCIGYYGYQSHLLAGYYRTLIPPPRPHIYIYIYISVQKDISKTNMIPSCTTTLGFFTIPKSSFVILYVVFSFSPVRQTGTHYGAWLLFQETSAWLLSGPTRNLN
jgi:hypothetical protein